MGWLRLNNHSSHKKLRVINMTKDQIIADIEQHSQHIAQCVDDYEFELIHALTIELQHSLSLLNDIQE